MSVYPFFENLDTSFVNLEALVRYLRRRKFVGTIRIDFTGYHCAIVCTDEAKIRAQEVDQVTGRTAIGQIAFNNIIARAKEAGGAISVVQLLSDKKRNKNRTIVSVSAIDGTMSVAAGSGAVRGIGTYTRDLGIRAEPEYVSSPLLKHLGFPSEMTSEIGGFASTSHGSNDDFDLMADLTGDLLKTIDNALERAGLDFSAAFEKACKDLSGEYSFLDPEKRLFKYSCGKVYINDGTDLRLFRKGLGEALASIFERLNAAPKLGKAHRFAIQKVRFLVQSRKEEFDRVRLTSQIEKALRA